MAITPNIALIIAARLPFVPPTEAKRPPFCSWHTEYPIKAEICLARGCSLIPQKKRNKQRWSSQQTQDGGSMLVCRWSTVYDGASTLNQHWFSVLCLLGEVAWLINTYHSASKPRDICDAIYVIFLCQKKTCECFKYSYFSPFQARSCVRYFCSSTSEK